MREREFGSKEKTCKIYTRNITLLMSSPATCLPKVTCLNVIQASSISLATRILLPNHLILTLCDVNEEEKYEIRKKKVKKQKQDMR